MRRLLFVLWTVSITSPAYSQPCRKHESEKQVRDVISSVMELRSKQDDGFLAYYANDEYSFPGESWVFHGQDRSAQRKPETQSARDLGMSWHMDIQDLHSGAGCDLAWIAGMVVAQQVDARNHPVTEARWRITAVLEKRQSRWVIVHQHSSLPNPDPKQWWKKVETESDP